MDREIVDEMLEKGRLIEKELNIRLKSFWPGYTFCDERKSDIIHLPEYWADVIVNLIEEKNGKT